MKSKFLFLILLFICGTVLYAADTTSDDNKPGTDYYDESQINKWIEDYTAKIRMNPYVSDNYLWRGVWYDEIGKYEDALNDFNAVLKIKPDDSYAYTGRADALSKMGRPEEAEKDLALAIRIDPANSDIYSTRAYHDIKYKKYDDAIKDFRLSARLQEEHLIRRSGKNATQQDVSSYGILSVKMKVAAVYYIQEKYEAAFNELLSAMANKAYRRNFYLNFNILITAFKVSAERYKEAVSIFRHSGAAYAEDSPEKAALKYVLSGITLKANTHTDEEEAGLVKKNSGEAGAVIGYTYLLTGDRVKAKEYFLKFKDKNRYLQTDFTLFVDKELSLLK